VKNAAQHALTFGFPVPGGERCGEGFELRWRGTAVMGIVNATPDSFSDGGQAAVPERAVARALELAGLGALVVDIGGESTRPGAEPVALEVEIDRVRPVLRGLRGREILVSVDTYKPEVAALALAEGAHLINDVSGLRDPEMVRVCAEAGAPAVVMHMQGTPATMQDDPRYGEVVSEVFDALKGRAEGACAAGVPAVMLDPGIGFGKTLEHNLALLRALPELVSIGYPVLLGASRKGLIRTLAGESTAAERDPGSLALHLWGAQQGVSMVRAHDVGAHVQALKVWQELEVGATG
jgi:dihydropteroate synthase